MTETRIYVKSARDIETVLGHYIGAALWSSTNEAGTPLESMLGAEDLADETLESMADDVESFLTEPQVLADVDGMSLEAVGIDFWLTRNGHGAGFWDRGLGERGDRLTTAAHAYGSSDLYVGDDGLVYVA